MRIPHFTTLLKQCVSTVLFHAKVPQKKIAQRSSSQYLILMYHRILPAAAVDATVEPGMYVSLESFAKHIAFLSQHFTLVPLASPLAAESHVSHKRPLCAITFDDGWLDFYQNAFPVLQQFQAPATVFLPTNFIGTKKAFWTDTIAHIIYHKQDLQKALTSMPPVKAQQWDNNLIVQHIFHDESTAGSDLELDQVVGRLKQRRADEIYSALQELTRICHSIRPVNRSFLNWDEVRTLHASGLVSFGSHTAEHNILTTIQADEVKHELLRSKERLLAEEAVDHDQPLLFCYPNGNANAELAAMVQDAGYAGAVTTRKDWNALGANRFLLNRIGLHEDMSSTPAMFACRLAGFI